MHPLHVLRRQHLILHTTAPLTQPSQPHLVIPLVVSGNAAMYAAGDGADDSAGDDAAIDAAGGVANASEVVVLQMVWPAA